MPRGEERITLSWGSWTEPSPTSAKPSSSFNPYTRLLSSVQGAPRTFCSRNTRNLTRNFAYHLANPWTVSRVKMVKLYFRQVLKNHQLEQGLFHDIIFVMCSYLFINTPSQSNTKQHPIPCQMTNYLMIALSLNSQLIYRVSQTLTYFHKWIWRKLTQIQSSFR